MEKLAPWNDSEVRWVCEEHPTKDQSHRLWFGFGKECGGAGMPENTQENRNKRYISPEQAYIDDLEKNSINQSGSLATNSDK